MLVTDHALDQEAWIQPDEGQLSVDVIETYESVIIRAAIAGVSVEDVDIYIAEDVVTVRGNRHLDQKEEVGSTYHFRECYWGGFSRTIVLPAHVRPDGADALMKNGVLTITLPKAVVETKIPIRFEE
ncbi:MAG: Hsp20/alpha crystallin family protein [Patescibacteria group bacterium]